MASIIERFSPVNSRGERTRKGYYALFRDSARSPQQKEVSLGTRSESAARTRMAEMELREAQGLYDPWTDPPPWKTRFGASLTVFEAIERFMKDRARTNGASGLANYRSVLDPFARSLPPGLMLVHLSAMHVSTWLDSRNVRPSSLKSYRDRLGIFFRWCVERKIAPSTWSPLPEVPARKDDRAQLTPAPKFYTPEELSRLLERVDACAGAGGRRAPLDRLLADVIRFTASTGFRRGEVCALRWSAVHLGRDGAPSYVSAEPSEGFVTKNGLTRVVPLVGDALVVVQARAAARPKDARPNDPVFPALRSGPEGLRCVHAPMLTRRLREHLQALGMRESAAGPRPNFHSLRHTFGTEAVSGGASIYSVQQVMGHARMQTTQGYAKVRPAALHDELSRALLKPRAGA